MTLLVVRGGVGVACKRTKRAFIGIEIDKKYYDIMSDRLNNEEEQLSIFDFVGGLE